jgi:exosome complex component RRP41
MRDLVCACAAGKVEGRLVLDLSDYEDKGGDADMPLAYMSTVNAVTLLQMDGILSGEEFEQAVKMAVEGCKQINQIQKEALRAKYSVEKEAETEKEAEAGEE